jgi:tyrosyl-tRNA synthetase
MTGKTLPAAKEQLDVLTLGVADLNSIEELEQLLVESHQQQKPLRIKTGFDPTAPDIHFGHTVLIEKMAQFQRFGHDVIFLIGDYTALIGDPTGRNTLRPPLSEAEIRKNALTYADQCYAILDRETTIIEWNSRWLSTLAFNDVISLASRYNLGRMLERRDFKQRFNDGRQIAMHEFLYPLVQGYDSVALKADVELGGHDQIFNLNVGRQIMSSYGLRRQVVLTVPLLVGVDGEEKMSKSKGNHIGITEPPREMFGKVMGISDETMWNWIPSLCGRAVDSEHDDPLAAKKRLAQEMASRFCGAQAGAEAATWWDAGRPADDLPPVELAVAPLFKIVQQAGGAESGSDARRKIQQGGVALNGERARDPMLQLQPGTYQLTVGKRFVVRVTIK